MRVALLLLVTFLAGVANCAVAQDLALAPINLEDCLKIVGSKRPRATFLCRDLSSAWDDPRAVSSRNEQKLVLDFRGERIEAGLLVRLIRTPFLLPRSFANGLRIANATVEGTLKLHDIVVSTRVSFVGTTFLGGGKNAEALSIINAHFLESFTIQDGMLFGAASVMRSRFTNSLSLHGLTVQSNKENRDINISDNIFEGSLFVLLNDAAGLQEIDLSSNQVRGSAYVTVPDEWAGLIKLRGTTILQQLKLDGPPSQHTGQMPKRWCPQPATRAGKRVAWVDLTQTVADRILWHLPLDCAHRWRGFGLKFGSIAFRSESEADFFETFNAWRFALDGYNVAALHTLADYAASLGRGFIARDIRYDAVRAQLSALRWPYNQILLLGLYPGGYGVKVERLLILAVMVFLFCYYMIYIYTRVYSWRFGVGYPNMSLVPGYAMYDQQAERKYFSLFLYALQATFPFETLRLQREFYPVHQAMRIFELVLGLLGIWLIANLVAMPFVSGDASVPDILPFVTGIG